MIATSSRQRGSTRPARRQAGHSMSFIHTRPMAGSSRRLYVEAVDGMFEESSSRARRSSGVPSALSDAPDAGMDPALVPTGCSHDSHSPSLATTSPFHFQKNIQSSARRGDVFRRLLMAARDSIRQRGVCEPPPRPLCPRGVMIECIYETYTDPHRRTAPSPA